MKPNNRYSPKLWQALPFYIVMLLITGATSQLSAQSFLSDSPATTAVRPHATRRAPRTPIAHKRPKLVARKIEVAHKLRPHKQIQHKRKTRITTRTVSSDTNTPTATDVQIAEITRMPKAAPTAQAPTSTGKAPVFAPANTMQAAIAAPARLAAGPIKVATPTLDSMTRDGSAPTKADAPATSPSRDLINTIVRTVLSLALVLAIAYMVVIWLRKRGYGSSSTDSDLEAAKIPTFGMNPFAVKLARQATKLSIAKSKSRLPVPKSLSLDVLGSGEVPGAGVRLYKLRVSDRILLIAVGAGGVTSLLSEWELEEDEPTSPDRFDTLLDEAANWQGLFPPDTESISDLDRRLKATSDRLAKLGARLASSRNDE